MYYTITQTATYQVTNTLGHNTNSSCWEEEGWRVIVLAAFNQEGG